jgi:hypothetical protein
MKKIDKIVFGDNQFFGINHMSQEKAQQQAEKFFDINNIFRVYENVLESGINGIMLNSNDRAREICDYFRENQDKFDAVNFYPSIPYPHKYANMIAEKGILPTINEALFKGNSSRNILSMISRGGSALVTKDAMKLMTMLVDVEMKMFHGLNVKVVFLQNIITDLMLGYGIKEVFVAYSEHIWATYNAAPGFITQNLPLLYKRLKEWGIEDVVICASFNKIGYLMSPDREAYEKIVEENDSEKYQIMAMSTLASGAIPAQEAYEYINKQNIQSVVFGASSKKNIDQTSSLIKL